MDYDPPPLQSPLVGWPVIADELRGLPAGGSPSPVRSGRASDRPHIQYGAPHSPSSAAAAAEDTVTGGGPR